MLRKAILVLLAIILAIPAYSQTVDEIISNSLKASGHTAHGKDLTSLKITGKMSMMGMDMDFTIFNKKPYFNRTEMDVMGSKIVQAVNEKEGWFINPMAGSSDAQKMPDEQFAKSKNENNFLSTPYADYKAKGTKIDYIGKETVGDKECYKLNVTTKEGDNSLLYIGTADNLPWMMQMKANQMGKEMEVQSYFKDYQEVKGVLIPHLVEIKADGQDQMKMTFDKVEANVPMDDSMFEMPK